MRKADQYPILLVNLLLSCLSGCATLSQESSTYDWSLLDSAIAPENVRPLVSSDIQMRPVQAQNPIVVEPPGVRLGMLREEVLEQWGEPQAVRRSSDPSADERWIYMGGVGLSASVLFHSGRVVGWRFQPIP